MDMKAAGCLGQRGRLGPILAATPMMLTPGMLAKHRKEE